MLIRGPSLQRPGGRRRAVVLVAAVLAAGVTARLGWWQLDRAQQKLDLQARITARGSLPPLPQPDLPRSEADAAAVYDRPVQLRGRWLDDKTTYLDNRQMNARQGFFVVTPLLLAPGDRPGDAVLVQRGWMPRDFSDRTKLQPLPAQPGTVLVSGRLAPPPAKLFEMGAAGEGTIRQNLDVAQRSRELGLALRPMSVQQTQPTRAAPADGDSVPALPDDGLRRDWPAVAVDVGKHHGYAFQWFSLSALLIGLTLWFQFLRPRWRARHPGHAPDQPSA